MLAVSAFSSQSTPSSDGEVRRPCTLSLPSSVPSPIANIRKRRAGTLSRIDLSAVATFSKELCSSSESLSGDAARGGEGIQSPSMGSEESLPCASSALGPFSDRIDPLKRLRLCSTSSTTTTTINGIALAADSDNDCPLQKPLRRPPTLAELELENGEESNSPKHSHLASGGLVIGDAFDGRFELVGDGRNCKAVDMASQTVFHCQVLTNAQFRHFSEIVSRVRMASAHYNEDEFEQRRDSLLPLSQLRLATSSARSGFFYVLLPDHHGNLHQLVEEGENVGPDRRNCETIRWTEGRMKPILKQMATLVEFCHRIGLFFRDFRLRKFVFSDSERTKVRVNNVLDLCLADSPTSDSLAFRDFVPAYVAPEILDRKNTAYGARAADIWAFGVLMFTLLNGRYPFFEASPSPIALLRRIRAHRLSFPISNFISESARWLLYSLLNQNPSERPTAKELLEAHWFRNGVSPGDGTTPMPKCPTVLRRKFCREVPSSPERFVPSFWQLTSQLVTTFSPSGESPQSLAEFGTAQRFFPRQIQRRAFADQMERTRMQNERTRQIRALLADTFRFPPVALNRVTANATHQTEANRRGLATVAAERLQRAVSESRRPSAELRHRGQSTAMRPSAWSIAPIQTDPWRESPPTSAFQRHSEAEEQSQIVPS
ncbi:hypothetical protein niasHT_024205 [Heterodera trifolii]|uniref:Protein kinase domain-containing protein n=1 Tax=Heterodera trifolii TaxID=157864 RepID=A0ABD2JLY2_9BILA